MAGIGFELKKLFGQTGALAKIRAYGYTALVCTGPMLLSIVLLLVLRMLLGTFGADRSTQDLLMTMIAYCLLASLLVSSLFSMVTTRYTADMIYEEKTENVLPSLYGSLALQFTLGGIAFGALLMFSGLPWVSRLLCLFFFFELITVWTLMNYLTAIKDFRSIVVLFFVGVVTAVLSAWCALRWLKWDAISAIMTAVFLGYGVIMAGFLLLLHRFFPMGQGNPFAFLRWIDKYPTLPFIGLLLTGGLFAHILIYWFGPQGVRIQGIFFGAPQYDAPALVAFLSLLVTTINFTVFVEVNFYPYYRRYIDLFNGDGVLSDIEQTENEMLSVLRHEMGYLAFRQVFATVLFIALGAPLLVQTNMGFTEGMIGTYRVLCVGYGLYAIANSMLLILLYFSDNIGAFWSALAFAATSVIATLALLNAQESLIGFGFLFAGAAMYAVAWARLGFYTKKLQHHTLSSQPVLLKESVGPFTRLEQWLGKRARTRQNIRRRGRATRVQRAPGVH